MPIISVYGQSVQSGLSNIVVLICYLISLVGKAKRALKRCHANLLPNPVSGKGKAGSQTVVVLICLLAV